MKIAINLILITLLTACSSAKVLNETLAKKLISDSLRSANYETPIAEISALLTRSNTDYGVSDRKTGNALLLTKLVHEKLVNQVQDVVTYPNLSGIWEDRSDRYIWIFSLQAVPNSNRVSGTCQTNAGAFGRTNGLTASNISGAIDNNNELTLRGNLS